MAPQTVKLSIKNRLSFGLYRLWRFVLLLVVVLMAAPFILIPLYLIVQPLSTLMLADLLTFKPYQRHWVANDQIAKIAVYSVVMSEDARHCAHHGVDWIEMKKAWTSIVEGGRGRGASTITMQTVKNLFLWNSRSFIRKAVELPLALYADFVWSKQRTLEIYLNIAEWGDGIYGIDAAARHYFNVPAAKLTARQAALLAVTLPNPLNRNPAKPTRALNRLADAIIARARNAKPYTHCLSRDGDK